MTSATEQASPRAEPERPPSHGRSALVLQAAALVVMAVMATQVLVGAVQIGTSNDEPLHQARMRTWFETGWYVPMRFIDEATEAPSAEFEGRKHTYGAAFSIVAHAFNVLTGAESPGQPNRAARAYVGRSLAIGVLGLAAVAAVALALIVLTGRRSVGLWAGAALLAIPAWTGYSMFAIKDTPAAAGWTMLTAGLTVALVPGRRWRRPTSAALLCFSGVWFSFGVRTALWVIVATSLLTFAVLVLASLDRSGLGRNVVAVCVGTAAGFIAVSALHYRNAATPVRWLSTAVGASRDFHWTGATLTAGQLVTETPPWWYLPAWVLGSLPLMLGLLMVVGLGFATLGLLRPPKVEGFVGGPLGLRHSAVVLWAHQALLIPVAATLTNATMYGGLRQHLYMLPALAALAGAAVWRLMEGTERRHLVHAALIAALIFALFVPVVEQSRLFPYNYTYKNVVAGPVGDRWEADMHWTSRREALGRVPADVDAFFYTQATRMLSGDIRTRRLRVAENSVSLGPFIAEQGSIATAQSGDDRIWVVARPYRGSPPNPGCREHDNVTRWLRGEQVVMSYVLLCDPLMAPEG